MRNVRLSRLDADGCVAACGPRSRTLVVRSLTFLGGAFPSTPMRDERSQRGYRGNERSRDPTNAVECGCRAGTRDCRSGLE